MLLKNYFDHYKFKTILSIYVVLLFFVFNISTHAETTNISGVVTSVEVLTANYLEEVPETRNICEIRQVPITAQKKSTGPSENKLLGAIIGGVLGSKVGEGSGNQAATAFGALLGSSLSSGEEINSNNLAGAILGGVAGSQVGSGSGNKAATAAGALIGSELANNNTDVIGYEDREVCEVQNVLVKKSINKVTGYRIIVSADNRELIFDTKRSAQPGDVVSIRRTLIYDLN
jgi:uncharacterized protein YcfJ